MAKTQRPGGHGMTAVKGSASGDNKGGRKQTFTRATQNLENDIYEEEGRIGQPRDTDDARPGGSHKDGRVVVETADTLEGGGAAMEVGPDTPRAIEKRLRREAQQAAAREGGPRRAEPAAAPHPSAAVFPMVAVAVMASVTAFLLLMLRGRRQN